MLNLTEFKNRYKQAIYDYQLTEQEILESYSIYLEDPEQFNEGMIDTVYGN
jgi:hypothetical protein